MNSIRQTLLTLALNNPYRDPEGRFMVRVMQSWTSPVYDRRGKPLEVQAGDLVIFDLEDMQAVLPGRGHNYIPNFDRDRAEFCGKAIVAVWDMFDHIVNNCTPVTGPDSFAAVGVDPLYADSILAVLLARKVVTVEQIRSIYDHVLEADVLPEHTWAWG